MPLAFFVLTQYRRVTDRQTDSTDGQTRCCAYYPRWHSVARVKTVDFNHPSLL